MKSIITFVAILVGCFAVDPTTYDDAVLRPSGEPQHIHASLPVDVSKTLSSSPTFDYITNSFGNYIYGGYSYPYTRQSGYQTAYQYIKNAKPTIQVNQRYPLQQTYPLETYYPSYQYETRYYPQYIVPSYGYIIPFKK